MEKVEGFDMSLKEWLRRYTDFLETTDIDECFDLDSMEV